MHGTHVGNVERILRVLIGLVFVGLAITGTVGWWDWLGLVPLTSGVFG